MRAIQAVLMLMNASRMPWFCILRCSGVSAARRRRGTPAARPPLRRAAPASVTAPGASPAVVGSGGVVTVPSGVGVLRGAAGSAGTAPCGLV